MTEDIISRIDQAVGCQKCGMKLRENGPSPDFCSEECQRMWHVERVSKPWPETAVTWIVGNLTTGEVYEVYEETRPAPALSPADFMAGREALFEAVDRIQYGVPLPGFRPMRGWLAKWFNRMRGDR